MGGEIKLESGPRRTAQRPLLQRVNASQWKWKTVISTSWKLQGEAITALEARAVILALKWRSRSVTQHGRRVLHVKDSAVALGAFVKHRSHARSLTYWMKRSASLQLAADFWPVLAHVRTHRNPADKPSRRVLPVRKLRNLWKGAKSRASQGGAGDC